ncbi:MAG TPA: PQQ-binding-like beta-propeller repeat protein [Polyangiales bacterium]|nr:PQQ-binding-like beta-propeller repeat protein [Polyangiales bacterium]
MQTTFFTLSALIVVISAGCSESHAVEAARQLAEQAAVVQPAPSGGRAGSAAIAGGAGNASSTRGASGSSDQLTARTKAVTEEERAMRQRADADADAKSESTPDAWPGFGGGLEQTFASVKAPIDQSNLKMIGTAWEKTAPGGVTGTPVVFDGVVYWTDWVGNVHADNASDGEEIWSKTYERGFTSSPFVTDDTLYLSNRDNMVYALERSSGRERWATKVIEAELAQLWSSPTVVDGVVIVGIGCKGTSDGFVPFDEAALMAFRGGVIGLDAATGKVRWSWDNTRGPDGTQFGPGVSSWSTAAVDTKRKVAYIGAGNSYYTPASPYSDSLLALDYATDDPKGHLVWSRQFTQDDNFTSGSPLGPDYDVGSTPNLYSLDGKDYVAVGDKGGRFYILERETGKLLSTTAAGSGSSLGGVIAPAAYGGGALYQAANNLGTAIVQRINAKTGESEWATTLSTGLVFGAPLLLKDVLLVGTASAFPSSRAQPGTIVALDRQTGEQVADWSLSVANQRGGGMSIYHNTLFLPYGYVFENSAAESTLAGGLLAAAIGGKVMQPPKQQEPTATHEPTYSAIYSEILEPQGCTADRCHGGLGLKLSKQDTGFKSLQDDVGSGACAGMKFIVPGKPNESLLYRKVADEMPPCGARMPLSLMPLDAEQLTQMRTWIEMGAKEN